MASKKIAAVRSALQVGSLLFAMSAPVHAQGTPTEDAPAIEDIIVTGTKASAGEIAQDVPIAISVLSGAAIDRQSIRDLTEIGFRTPNVRLQPTGTMPSHASFSMRGLGNNSAIPSDEPVVVTVMDGMVLGTAYGSAFDTFDIEAVEIYRGPQGVLFGKNSTGGAVNVRSRRPSGKSELILRFIAGSHDRLSGAVAAETPIIGDVLSARVAAMYNRQDGYFREGNFPGKRTGGGGTNWTIRPSIRFTPDDKLDVTLIGEFSDYDGDAAVFRSLATSTIAQTVFGAPACRRTVICRAARSSGVQDSQHVIGEINYDLGIGTLTSVTAYRQLSFTRFNSDLDGTSAPILLTTPLIFDQKQFSEELRLAGKAFDDKLSYVVGLFYFNDEWLWQENQRTQASPASPVVATGGKARQNHDSKAIFGQLTYQVTPSLSFIAGGRYTIEKKRLDLSTLAPNNCNTPATCTFQFVDLPFKSKKFSPKLGVEWKAAEDINLYASYTRGFRAGGYNSRGARSPQQTAYNDETIKAYEIGLKSDWFDKRLRLNIALFRNELGDLQRQIATSVPGMGTTTVVRNAASAVMKGAEVEAIVAPLDGLTFNLAAGYLKARYKRFDGIGFTPAQVRALRFERAPEWTFNAGANYRFAVSSDMHATTSVNYSFTDEYPANTLNTSGYNVPKLHLLDATAGLEIGDHLRVSVFGKNLTNEIYGVLTAVQLPVLLSQVVAAPRTWGIQVDYKF